MANEMLDSPCFGEVWDALTENDCKNCKGQHSCKDKFVNGVFREYVTPEGADKLTNEEISKALGVSIPAVEECRTTLASIMGDDEMEKAVEKEVKEEEKQVEETKPPKKRKGRKPADLMTCPLCNGSGYTEAGKECEACKGYGDVSEKKWKASKLSKELKDLKKEVKKVTEQPKALEPVVEEKDINIVDLDKVREDRQVGLGTDIEELFRIMRTGPIKNINMDFFGVSGKKKCALGVIVTVDADLILNS